MGQYHVIPKIEQMIIPDCRLLWSLMIFREVRQSTSVFTHTHMARASQFMQTERTTKCSRRPLPTSFCLRGLQKMMEKFCQNDSRKNRHIFEGCSPTCFVSNNCISQNLTVSYSSFMLAGKTSRWGSPRGFLTHLVDKERETCADHLSTVENANSEMTQSVLSKQGYYYITIIIIIILLILVLVLVVVVVVVVAVVVIIQHPSSIIPSSIIHHQSHVIFHVNLSIMRHLSHFKHCMYHDKMMHIYIYICIS